PFILDDENQVDNQTTYSCRLGVGYCLLR
ncbi:uncharacterized protein METZ01_LOCUS354468, partial [marine metagenome]